MKRLLFWALFLGIVYIIQSSLLYPLAYTNISADLILLTVVYLSIIYGDYPVLYGFVGGMFQDLASGSFLGIHTFSLIILCLIVDYMGNYIDRDNILIPLCVGFFFTIINHSIIDVLIFLLGYSQGIIPIIKSMGISVIYNIIFAYPMWFIMQKLKIVIERYFTYQIKK